MTNFPLLLIRIVLYTEQVYQNFDVPRFLLYLTSACYLCDKIAMCACVLLQSRDHKRCKWSVFECHVYFMWYTISLFLLMSYMTSLFLWWRVHNLFIHIHCSHNRSFLVVIESYPFIPFWGFCTFTCFNISGRQYWSWCPGKFSCVSQE